MTDQLSPADQASVRSIVQGLENAWNTADGEAYAAAMADDADFVNVRAEHIKGREAIAAGHTGIFRTIYAGSRNRLTLDSARLLREDVALVHVRAVMEAPTGPLAVGISFPSITPCVLARRPRFASTSRHQS